MKEEKMIELKYERAQMGSWYEKDKDGKVVQIESQPRIDSFPDLFLDKCLAEPGVFKSIEASKVKRKVKVKTNQWI